MVAGVVFTQMDVTRVLGAHRLCVVHTVVAGVAFTQMDVTRVLRVHRLCVVHTVVASGVCIQMVVERVYRVALTCVLHTVVGSDAITNWDATSMWCEEECAENMALRQDCGSE